MGLPGGGGGAGDSSIAVRTPLLQSAASAPAPGSAAFHYQHGYRAAAGCDGDTAAPHATGQRAASHLAHRRSCDLVARHRVPSLQDLDALHRHRAWHRRLAAFVRRR
jgi:hypothetical protein